MAVQQQKLDAEHGIVCRKAKAKLGYFAWPTLARSDDGTLFVAGSGLRGAHVDPHGKTILTVSHDDGQSWSEPKIIQNSLIDDRDAGLISLGGDRILVSWFRSDTRMYTDVNWVPEKERTSWTDVLKTWTDSEVIPLIGSWTMLSEDAGKTWSSPRRAPVTAPHGPIRLQNGDLLYLGKPYETWENMLDSAVSAARSRDDGLTWEISGTVPLYPGTAPCNYCEPHIIELPSGRLIGMLRMENRPDSPLDASGILPFSLTQTESDDGGRTWSVPRPLGFHGSPAHLMRHSSGHLILTYGYRETPFGQRVAFSSDDGATWDSNWILRDDGPDADLGYPSTVELADGSLFSVYYQQAAAGEPCSLLWSRWISSELHSQPL